MVWRRESVPCRSVPRVVHANGRCYADTGSIEHVVAAWRPAAEYSEAADSADATDRFAQVF